MSKHVVFDRGTHSDVDEIKRFTSNTWRVGYYNDLYRTIGNTGTMEDYVDKIIEKWVEEGSVYVLRVDGSPVATIHFDKLSDGSIMLGGLRVDPEHRGAKYGLRIMQETMDFLRDKAKRLRSAVYSWNTPSLNLVKKLGFHPIDEYEVYTFENREGTNINIVPSIAEYSGRYRCVLVDWKYICSEHMYHIYESYRNNFIVDSANLIYFDSYEGGIDFVINDSDDVASFIDENRKLNGRIMFYVRKDISKDLPFTPSSSMLIWEFTYDS
ncbi:hypothetical protein DMB44_04650 [Thermoplasma sp. Kam2015]|uniref:GNAT family N-acetyltransferase n=1 Tax=Thermoplasma sp. Kam2015 TaxID=2094122 RepID=UPI000D82EAAF|nr:GNAT family N-acetyltransferase [Thermoplasma sp. Kam2015]PYB68339.1 hypothetical protein DMB44_04650 [Thermoplasma sp. Kam2015]